MQDDNSDFLKFSDRVTRICEKLRINKGSFAAMIDVNRQHLSAWLNGKSPLTAKAWRKLEAAERSAGILPRTHPHPLLSHTPHAEQPSDEHIQASQEEFARVIPTNRETLMLSELRDLAFLKHPDNEANQQSELDRLMILFSEAQDEAIVRAAHAHVLMKYRRPSADGGEILPLTEIPIIGEIAAGTSARCNVKNEEKE